MRTVKLWTPKPAPSRPKIHSQEIQKDSLIELKDDQDLTSSEKQKINQIENQLYEDEQEISEIYEVSLVS